MAADRALRYACMSLCELADAFLALLQRANHQFGVLSADDARPNLRRRRSNNVTVNVTGAADLDKIAREIRDALRAKLEPGKRDEHGETETPGNPDA